MTGIGPMLLPFFVLQRVTDDPLVDKNSKEKIFDLIGRGCIYFKVSGLLSC